MCPAVLFYLQRKKYQLLSNRWKMKVRGMIRVWWSSASCRRRRGTRTFRWPRTHSGEIYYLHYCNTHYFETFWVVNSLNAWFKFIRFRLFFCCRTLLALGFHIGLTADHAEEKVKYMRLANKYVHVWYYFRSRNYNVGFPHSRRVHWASLNIHLKSYFGLHVVLIWVIT